jgi:hypothetical protein
MWVKHEQSGAIVFQQQLAQRFLEDFQQNSLRNSQIENALRL